MSPLGEAFNPRVHAADSTCAYSRWDPVVRAFVDSLMDMFNPETVTYSADIPIAQHLDRLEAKIEQLAQQKLFTLFKTEIDKYLALPEILQKQFFEAYPEIDHECATCKENLFCLCAAPSVSAMALHEYTEAIARNIPNSTLQQLEEGPVESLQPDQLRARNAMERLRTLAKGSGMIPQSIMGLYLRGDLALIQ